MIIIAIMVFLNFSMICAMEKHSIQQNPGQDEEYVTLKFKGDESLQFPRHLLRFSGSERIKNDKELFFPNISKNVAIRAVNFLSLYVNEAGKEKKINTVDGKSIQYMNRFTEVGDLFELAELLKSLRIKKDYIDRFEAHSLVRFSFSDDTNKYYNYNKYDVKLFPSIKTMIEGVEIESVVHEIPLIHVEKKFFDKSLVSLKLCAYDDPISKNSVFSTQLYFDRRIEVRNFFNLISELQDIHMLAVTLNYLDAPNVALNLTLDEYIRRLQSEKDREAVSRQLTAIEKLEPLPNELKRSIYTALMTPVVQYMQGLSTLFSIRQSRPTWNVDQELPIEGKTYFFQEISNWYSVYSPEKNMLAVIGQHGQPNNFMQSSTMNLIVYPGEKIHSVPVIPSVKQLLFSDNGEYLAAHNEHDICMYNTQNATLLWRENSPAAKHLYCFAFSSDAKSLFVGRFDGIDVYDISNGQKIYTLAHDKPVRSIGVHPKYNNTIVYSDSNEIHIASCSGSSLTSLAHQITLIDEDGTSKKGLGRISTVHFMPDSSAVMGVCIYISNQSSHGQLGQLKCVYWPAKILDQKQKKMYDGITINIGDPVQFQQNATEFGNITVKLQHHNKNHTISYRFIDQNDRTNTGIYLVSETQSTLKYITTLVDPSLFTLNYNHVIHGNVDIQASNVLGVSNAFVYSLLGGTKKAVGNRSMDGIPFIALNQGGTQLFSFNGLYHQFGMQIHCFDLYKKCWAALFESLLEGGDISVRILHHLYHVYRYIENRAYKTRGNIDSIVDILEKLSDAAVPTNIALQIYNCILQEDMKKQGVAKMRGVIGRLISKLGQLQFPLEEPATPEIVHRVVSEEGQHMGGQQIPPARISQSGENQEINAPVRTARQRLEESSEELLIVRTFRFIGDVLLKPIQFIGYIARTVQAWLGF